MDLWLWQNYHHWSCMCSTNSIDMTFYVSFILQPCCHMDMRASISNIFSNGLLQFWKFSLAFPPLLNDIFFSFNTFSFLFLSCIFYLLGRSIFVLGRMIFYKWIFYIKFIISLHRPTMLAQQTPYSLCHHYSQVSEC